ncbi:MAG TPA: hypothetical protein PLK63_14265 [Catalimonadaceae bacterium]|nr:hypothetical protein [Catalimonadaceae bacterium]
MKDLAKSGVFFFAILRDGDGGLLDGLDQFVGCEIDFVSCYS